MILHAGNGLVLTQSADVPMRDRLFLPHVTLRDMEEVKQWKEVTVKQRDEMLAEASIIDVDNMTVDSIKKMDTIVTKVAERINDVPMSIEESLELTAYFPKWEDGKKMPTGFKVSYDGSLYEVIQAHTSQAGWNPKDATSLYKVVQVSADGTEHNPIQWEQGMELVEGKYYLDEDVMYRCTRSSGMAMYYSLSALVGTYVEVNSNNNQ